MYRHLIVGVCALSCISVEAAELAVPRQLHGKSVSVA
jgi:hypothetical protein